MGITDRTSLGDRMKTYEAVTNLTLMPRAPVIIRVDGKGFSRLTKKLGTAKPFDVSFRRIMDTVMREMCAQIQGCVLGYAQSDEISFVIRDDQSEKAESYFGNRLQKLVSISAGMASAIFTREICQCDGIGADIHGVFDSRAFTMPDLTEAGNYLVWRQQDCTRNSILSATYYAVGEKKGRKTTRKMMYGLKTPELQELMFKEAGVNWNDYPGDFKRGSVVFRQLVSIETPKGKAMRSRWKLGVAPIFTSEEGRAWLYSTERLGDRSKED